MRPLPRVVVGWVREELRQWYAVVEPLHFPFWQR